MKDIEQLPDLVLAELYGKFLVCVDEEKKPAKTSANKKQPEDFYLGNYEKKIIVLVNDTDNIYVSDENLNFLSGILNACKLNLAHIALINFNKTALNFSELKKQLKPAHILLFGITALQIELPFTMPDYQLQQYDNCQILIAPSLQNLNNTSVNSLAEKKKLWTSLKKMFNIEK